MYGIEEKPILNIFDGKNKFPEEKSKTELLLIPNLYQEKTAFDQS